MLRRIVLWEFLPQAQGHTRIENMAKVKAMLEALPPVIPQIRSLTVNPNLENEPKYHMALTLTVDTPEDLRIYKDHPAHRAVSAFVSQVRGERVAVTMEEP
ncbi:MAG: Dabb family protein [Eubacteriales bacterium]|nr:Dabb family protein [Eubacteriales bacterium]